MKILIINLTNEPVDIRLADTSLVTIAPHKPYILDSFHRPEINFWTNCTDSRFKVIVDQNEVIRYSRVVANQLKHSAKVNVVKEEMSDTNETPDTTKLNDVVAEEIIKESNIEVIKTAEDISDTTSNNTVEDKEEILNKTVELTKEELDKMTVASLKVLASRLEVKLPLNAKRKEIIDILLKTEA